MRWLVKDMARLSAGTRRFLTAATPLGKDYMREGAELSGERPPGSYHAVVLYSGSHIVGWSMLDFALSRNSRAVRTYIYVKPRYRRNGFGTEILQKAREAARRRGRPIKVCPHTKCSRKFFQSVGITKQEVVRGYRY